MKRNSKFATAWPITVGICIAIVLAWPASAQKEVEEPQQGPHTILWPMSNRSSLVPGSHIWVGVWFQIEKGWHIYWENPGDSGEPPKIQWQMPAGFRVGAVEWPAPEKLMAPSIVDYGYENDVLLFAPLSVPAGLRNGESVTLAANVNWLVCREMCIPAKARVSLTLPVDSAVRGFKGAASSAEVAELINARAKVPKPLPAGWKVYATNEKNDFVLTVETGKQENAATFFPLDAEQINNDAPQAATPFAQGVRLRLQKSDGLLKPIAHLRGVLELGPGRAYQITAPVHAATTGNS
jgi:DsbC/DsbD-like thiol-disulfide interchange protein